MINFPPSPTTGDPHTDTDGVLWICEDDTVGDVRWVRRGNAISEANPIGAIINWAGTTPPAGYLACDGSALKRATYPDLFAAIGVLWNNTGGAISPAGDEFRIPPQNVGGLGLFMRGEGATVVGAYQEDVFKEHDHALERVSDTVKTGTSTRIIGNTNSANPTNPTWPTGDSEETRPRSITTMLCIKATYSAYTGDMGAVPVNSVGEAQLTVPELQAAGLLPTAWCVFSSPSTLKAGINFASVVRPSTGQFDFTFSVPMDIVDYSVVPSSINSGNGVLVTYLNKTTTGFRLTIVTEAGALFDPTDACVHIFGGKT